MSTTETSPTGARRGRKPGSKTVNKSTTPKTPTEAEIKAYLEKKGLTPVAKTELDALSVGTSTGKPKPQPRPAAQKTEREPFALPKTDFLSEIGFAAHPDYDYVHVQVDHPHFGGQNSYGPYYYTRLGYGKVPIERKEGQTVRLTYPNGASEEVREGVILMCRHKSVSARYREEEQRKNDPNRNSAEDVHMIHSSQGMIYQEDKPINGTRIDEILPDKSELDRKAERDRLILQRASGDKRFMGAINDALEIMAERDPGSILSEGDGGLTDE